MKQISLTVLLILFSFLSFAQSNKISLVNNKAGFKLKVDGTDFIINGMNWDYFPIGTNYEYNLWEQRPDFIQAALDNEMSVLKNMGVNTIRVYTGIPAKWISYIYKKHGIFTMLNHSFGRYGLSIEGNWIANTEYADPRVRNLLLQEVKALASDYKNTPGLLLYLLGNENNYGLFWEGAETEDIPEDDPKATSRARAMYKLFNEAALEMKKIDATHPIAFCNGDLQFLDLIVEECKDIDIFGTNIYRGKSFGDAYQRVKTEYNKPVLFTEFGADAFNTLENREDQEAQAYYLTANWKEIYENVAGMGKANNSLGGFTFQFTDGWWKFGQTKNLDVHDNNASWANGGYTQDFVKGKNNMNEEWFGICGKGPIGANGVYQLQPRVAYFDLKAVHQFNPYKSNSLAAVERHFSKISQKKDKR